MSGKWKIGILLECGYYFCKDEKTDESFIKISDNIYFRNIACDDKLLPCEVNGFCKGLKISQNLIKEAIDFSGNLMVCLYSAKFSDCNIQSEAFTAAAIQWTSETFSFTMPDINITFDKSRGLYGGYIFDFNIKYRMAVF